MEEDRIVYSFQRNPEEEVRFSFHEYKDRQYLDLRLWFQPSDGGPYRPTRKGLTLPVEYLGELQKGLGQMVKLASEMALHGPSNSVK